MHEVIRKLKADHRRFAHLVKHMERAMERCQHGEGVDVDMLEQFVEYCSGHADEHHHPLEDVLFLRMVLRDPAIAPLVRRIEDEHVKLYQATEELTAMLKAIGHRDFIPRAQFLDVLTNYLAAYHQHMESEEVELFSRADDLLDEEDWEAIEQWLAQRPSSPFDDEESPEYQRIEELLAQ